MGAKDQEEKIRVVLDTNILVSIILKKTLASELAPLIRDAKRIEVFSSRDLVSEFVRVLTYPRIVNVLVKASIDPKIALGSILEFVTIGEVEQSVNVIIEDPADNAVLECALAVHAEYIVSGDPHLLKVREFRGIRIMNARSFINLMKQKPQ